MYLFARKEGGARLKKRKIAASWNRYIRKIQKRLNRREQREEEWLDINRHNDKRRYRMRSRAFKFFERKVASYEKAEV